MLSNRQLKRIGEFTLKGYREYSPPNRLEHVVDCFWISSRERSQPVNYRVLPDNSTDIIFDSVRSGYERGVVCGTMTTALVLKNMVACDSIGVRLKPGWAEVVTGHPANQLTDQIIPFEDVIEKDRISAGDDAKVTLEGLQQIVSSIVATATEPDRRIGVACRLLSSGSSVQSASRTLDVTRQTLRRLFLRHVGVTPKKFASVARIQRIVSMADQQQDTNWANLAVEHGFFDQPHLIRDFAILTGTTPEAFLFERMT